MKKRILSILLLCCMVLTMLPTAAFAAVSDSLGNTPKENQAILEQLSALTGGSSDQVLSMLNALGLLDEDGNFKVDQTITLDGRVLTLAAVMELLENPATDLTRIADVDGTPVALGDLKTMIQIEQELQRIKDTYFSGREFTGEAVENLNSLMEQLELQGISLQYSASATKPEGVETVDMSGMMSQTLGGSRKQQMGIRDFYYIPRKTGRLFLPHSKRPAQQVYHQCGGLDRRGEWGRAKRRVLQADL